MEEFVEMIARLETDGEFYERTGDSLSDDDLLNTLANLIHRARRLTAK